MPEPQAFHWKYRGLEWQRTRHTFAGTLSGFAIDTMVMSKSEPSAWTILVVKESWWAKDGSPLKSTQRVKPLAGNKQHIRRWIVLRSAAQPRLRPRKSPPAGLAEQPGTAGQPHTRALLKARGICGIHAR
jgi:hypothetical protein